MSSEVVRIMEWCQGEILNASDKEMQRWTKAFNHWKARTARIDRERNECLDRMDDPPLDDTDGYYDQDSS